MNKKEIIRQYVLVSDDVPEQIAETISNRFSMHQDIENELVCFIQTSEFPENPIWVEGYTAEMLYASNRLNYIGAYSYLAFLREKPDEALDRLKRRLPQK